MPVQPPGPHNIWNDTQVTETIESYDCVVAFINGHDHNGNYVKKDRIHYLTLMSMLEAVDYNFAVVEIYKNHIRIDGYGQQPDRIMTITENLDK